MSHLPKHTKAIVLSRINYGESDRIVRFLTHDYGKISAIAKGTRKEHSKLAGGIELFSISDIGFVEGRGELCTLVSSRLIKHYEVFLNNLEKVDFAYSCLKSVNKITADATDKYYFLILEQLFKSLNEPELPLQIISCWWYAKLSELTGHTINTTTLIGGKNFIGDQNYLFDGEHGGFKTDTAGSITPNHIKFLRLAVSHGPHVLAKVNGGSQLADDLLPCLRGFVEYVH